MENLPMLWEILLLTFMPFILIFLFILLWLVKKHLERRKWKPITARVLRIEAIDPPIGNGVVASRRYKLDLVFQWQGLDWYRSWIFPRIYNLPKAGDVLQLLYNQEKEDFQSVISPAEKQKIRLFRLGLCLFIFAIPLLLRLFSLLSEKVPFFPLWLFADLFLVIRFIRAIGGSRRLRRRIEQGELRPIKTQIREFRKDSEGDVHAFCRITIDGQEREVTLFDSFRKHYEVGQRVTVYLDPENMQTYTYPDTYGRSKLIWGGLVVVFAAIQLFCLFFL